MKQIIAALLKAQKEMGNAVKNGTNPHFKSKFADLNSVREAVIPLLNENGILVLQPMVNVEGNEYVRTVLLHDSGETIESLTKIVCKAQNDPQALGSAITYARRYGLQSLVCIGAEDDDGNSASVAKKQPTFTISDAIADFSNVADRKSFESCMIKYASFMKDEKVLSLCKELSVKYPKP